MWQLCITLWNRPGSDRHLTRIDQDLTGMKPVSDWDLTEIWPRSDGDLTRIWLGSDRDLTRIWPGFMIQWCNTNFVFRLTRKLDTDGDLTRILSQFYTYLVMRPLSDPESGSILTRCFYSAWTEISNIIVDDTSLSTSNNINLVACIDICIGDKEFCVLPLHRCVFI